MRNVFILNSKGSARCGLLFRIYFEKIFLKSAAVKTLHTITTAAQKIVSGFKTEVSRVRMTVKRIAHAV